jgi:hypothetical protein
MHLTATRRIKSGPVKHDCHPATAVKRFDHTSVEVAKKRIVIIEAISHWKLSAVSTWNLSVG